MFQERLNLSVDPFQAKRETTTSQGFLLSSGDSPPMHHVFAPPIPVGENKDMGQSTFTTLINFTQKDQIMYLEGELGIRKTMSIFSSAIKNNDPAMENG